MRLARAVLGAATVLAAGCIYTSRPADRDALATQPAGTTGVVQLGLRPTVRGELLAVQDSSYLLLVGGRVALVPFAEVREASFERVGRAQDFLLVAGPSRERVTELRLVSRFPYGVPARAMQMLLAQGGQTAPDTLRAAERP